ncbi:MAG: hypothetical protein CHACPFDD_01877 [Phycisphaerae bacterium]|nr:hypothetical protein [Phycisphaerae bacterium]
MGPTLQALRELQQLELQVIDVQQQIGRRERAVEAQKRKLDELGRVIESVRHRLHDLQRDADSHDLDLKTRTANMGKLREALNSVKTNKEYAAVLAQLNTEKADVGRLENSVMEKLVAVDQGKADLAAQQQIEINEIARREDLQQQLEKTRASFNDRLTRLVAQRDAAAARIDAKSRGLFERMSERYGGEAMARIVRTHPRRDEFVCEGCNMSINAQRYNAVVTRDEVQQCSNCGRILYVDSDR